MPKRKLFELKINPELELNVDAIALVEYPAIEVDYMAFSKNLNINFSEKSDLKFSINQEKQELFGIAMIPELRIPRIDNDGNEFDVFFSKETIRLIAQNYFHKGFHHNINIEHTEQDAKCYVFQSYIIDKAKGIDSPFKEAVDGTWIVGLKVTDNDTWEKIKNGELKGFSIEGIFNQIEQNFSQNSVVKTLFDNKNILSSILNKYKNNQRKMNKEIKKLFGTEFEKIKNLFTEDDNSPIIINEDEVKGDLVIGGKIERLLDDKLEPIEDGVYKIGEKEIEIVDGLITTIDGVGAEKEEPKKEEMEDVLPNQQVMDLQEQIDSMTKDIEAMKGEIEAMKGDKKEDENVIEEMKKQFSQLTSVLEKFAKIPASESKIITTEKEKQKAEKEKNMNAFISGFRMLNK